MGSCTRTNWKGCFSEYMDTIGKGLLRRLLCLRIMVNTMSIFGPNVPVDMNGLFER
jgi:hypothetical protein|uniref:Uncharacterized protein n=2 Tax=Picea TaxID=3328 RepID=A0A101LVK5_PICGL|nr:hypothetical protein ABT39_MTgene2061 [Picea glauca]QHR92746.1 hypothetical protein Q903MT_gene6794 [Picea sitchensis]